MGQRCVKIAQLTISWVMTSRAHRFWMWFSPQLCRACCKLKPSVMNFTSQEYKSRFQSIISRLIRLRCLSVDEPTFDRVCWKQVSSQLFFKTGVCMFCISCAHQGNQLPIRPTAAVSRQFSWLLLTAVRGKHFRKNVLLLPIMYLSYYFAYNGMLHFCNREEYSSLLVYPA